MLWQLQPGDAVADHVPGCQEGAPAPVCGHCQGGGGEPPEEADA